MALSRRLRAWAINLALTVASVLLVLLAAELVTRWFGHVEPPLRVRDSKIGEHYLESFDQNVYQAESATTIRLRFDRDGFRNPDRPEAKPAGTRRIAVFGDSMVAALAVEEPETLTGRLAAELGSGYEVMNYGITASSPGQALVLYREVVSKYSPDTVVLGFFVGNDLSDSSKKLDYYPRIYFDLDPRTNELVQAPYTATRARASSILNRYSRFYVWQKTAFNLAVHTVAEKGLQQMPPALWVYSSAPPPEVEEAWKIVAAVFEKFRAEVEARGGKFVVLEIPSGHQIYDGEFDSVLALAGENKNSFSRDEPDRRLAAICTASRVDCVFITEELRKAATSGELLYFGKSGHMTGRGYSAAARALAPHVR